MTAPFGPPRCASRERPTVAIASTRVIFRVPKLAQHLLSRKVIEWSGRTEAAAASVAAPKS